MQLKEINYRRKYPEVNSKVNNVLLYEVWFTCIHNVTSVIHYKHCALAANSMVNELVMHWEHNRYYYFKLVLFNIYFFKVGRKWWKWKYIVIDNMLQSVKIASRNVFKAATFVCILGDIIRAMSDS